MNITDADITLAEAIEINRGFATEDQIPLVNFLAAHRIATRRKALEEASDMIDICDPIAPIIAIRAMIEGETDET